jgi:hypothetical protein
MLRSKEKVKCQFLLHYVQWESQLLQQHWW